MNSETQAVYDALAANQGKTLRESANFDSNRARLLADLKVLVADADKLLREAAGASAEQFATLQMRMEARLVDARAKLARARTVAGDKAQQATSAAQAYVRANPWQAAGVLIAAGVALGFFLTRRSPALDDSAEQ